MQKTHMKLGLIIAIACLFMVAGMFATDGVASAHTVQSAKKFHPWLLQAPHITVKLLSTSGRHSKNAYIGRAVISGEGFSAANGYGPCDSCGNNTSASTSIACISIDCGSSSTTTTTSSTTTTSTTTTSPSDQTGTDATCPNSCGNAPVGTSDQTDTSTTCPNSCGNAPVGTSDQTDTSTTCPSSCGNAPVAPRNQPGPSATCPSSCGNAPVAPRNQPGPSSCGCNTVNLQSSTPISAYTPGIDLSQVPVNAFGEFRVIVNVRPTVRHYTVPAIWAINTYNDQPSNYAPMCYCS